MDYLHTYPHGILRYYASDMILKITSDAAYLVQSKARSHAAAHYHLGWNNSTRTNGPVDILCKTIKNVVSSAVEAETGSIYMSGKQPRMPDANSPHRTRSPSTHHRHTF
jgi:hypothetical protein